MRRHLIIILFITFLVIAGCGAQSETDCTEYSLLRGIEMIPNPLFEELTVEKRITRIIAELTTLISEKISEREVEQTTHNKRTTIPAKITDMVEIVNQYRVEADLNQLKLSGFLCEIAGFRAKESAEKWSHTRPNGQKLNSLLDNSEWSTAGENLAKYKNASPQKIVDAWMNSDSHKENLLNARYKFCGISEYYDGEIRYISMIFTD